MADEADDDGEMEDFVFGDFEVGVVFISRSAKDGVFLVEDAFEDDSLGSVEDMGTPPLDKPRLLDKDTRELVAGEDVWGHGVASGNDCKVIIRESRNKGELLALQSGNSGHSDGQSAGSSIEGDTGSSLPLHSFRNGTVVNFYIGALDACRSCRRDIIFTFDRICFDNIRINPCSISG